MGFFYISYRCCLSPMMLTMGDAEIPNFSKLKDFGIVMASSSSKIGNEILYKVQNDSSTHIWTKDGYTRYWTNKMTEFWVHHVTRTLNVFILWLESSGEIVQLNSDFVVFDYQFHAPAKNSTTVIWKAHNYKLLKWK